MSHNDKVGTVVLFAISLVGFALGIWVRRKETVAGKWPQVAGKIVTSTFVMNDTGNSGREAVPVIEYEFEYGGMAFKSARWRFGNYSTGSLDSAQAITARYPVGSDVTVYVNASQPNKSVLETTKSSLSWIGFGFAIFMFAIGLLVLFAENRQH